MGVSGLVARPTVVILGGGIGGLVASNILADRLGERAEIKVIDRKGFFQFPPSYPWVMLGQREPDQVQRELISLKKKGIAVVRGEVSEIDLERRSVTVDGSTHPYDYLIIALGAEYAPERIPGLVDLSHNIYDLESAVRCREALAGFSGGTVAVGVASVPFKCPAAPYETALLIQHHFKQRGLDAKVRVEFFTPEGLPLPAAGPDIGNGALELLRSRGLEARFKAKLQEVRPGEALFDDGSTLAFDLLIAVPPHACPRVVQEAGLTDETGWVPVDPGSMRTKRAGVFAIGDITSVPTPSGFVPFLPKAGVFAHGQAGVVAHNIAAEITGRGKLKSWDGAGACFLMTGGAQAAFVKGTWFAEPRPEVRYSPPSRVQYMQRVLFEKYWMHHWF
jgi:sulfide:quinone oxidoreductase